MRLFSIVKYITSLLNIETTETAPIICELDGVLEPWGIVLDINVEAGYTVPEVRLSSCSLLWGGR